MARTRATIPNTQYQIDSQQELNPGLASDKCLNNAAKNTTSTIIQVSSDDDATTIFKNEYANQNIIAKLENNPETYIIITSDEEYFKNGNLKNKQYDMKINFNGASNNETHINNETKFNKHISGGEIRGHVISDNEEDARLNNDDEIVIKHTRHNKFCVITDDDEIEISRNQNVKRKSTRISHLKTFGTNNRSNNQEIKKEDVEKLFGAKRRGIARMISDDEEQLSGVKRRSIGRIISDDEEPVSSIKSPRIGRIISDVETQISGVKKHSIGRIISDDENPISGMKRRSIGRIFGDDENPISGMKTRSIGRVINDDEERLSGVKKGRIDPIISDDEHIASVKRRSILHMISDDEEVFGLINDSSASKESKTRKVKLMAILKRKQEKKDFQEKRSLLLSKSKKMLEAGSSSSDSDHCSDETVSGELKSKKKIRKKISQSKIRRTQKNESLDDEESSNSATSLSSEEQDISFYRNVNSGMFSDTENISEEDNQGSIKTFAELVRKQKLDPSFVLLSEYFQEKVMGANTEYGNIKKFMNYMSNAGECFDELNETELNSVQGLEIYVEREFLDRFFQLANVSRLYDREELRSEYDSIRIEEFLAELPLLSEGKIPSFLRDFSQKVENTLGRSMAAGVSRKGTIIDVNVSLQKKLVRHVLFEGINLVRLPASIVQKSSDTFDIYCEYRQDASNRRTKVYSGKAITKITEKDRQIAINRMIAEGDDISLMMCHGNNIA
jgi:hypothetical protein